VETNIVIYDVTDTGKTAPQVAEAMKQERVLIHAFGKTQIRMVTHLDLNGDHVEMSLKAYKKVFR